MPVDLHTHSRVSDGSDDPAALVRKAAAIGLSAIALTDHDTLEGIAEARAAADDVGIEVIPGTEVSAGKGTHMVVLFLEPGPGPLQDRLAEIRAGREARNARIIGRLNELGIDIALDEVVAEAGAGVVGRPHFAAVLVRKGVVPDTEAAFDEYLATSGRAYVPRLALGAEETARLARASGAVPVLAHPHTVQLDDEEGLAGLLGRLTEAGLVGVEVHYPGYDHTRRRELTAVAEATGLLISGGSDYHGTYKSTIELGSGLGDVSVPSSVLEALRARAR